MLRDGWVQISLAGAVAIIATFVVPNDTGRVAILVGFTLIAVVSIVIAAIRYRPDHRWVWLSFAAGAGLMAIATALGVWYQHGDPIDATNLFVGFQVGGSVIVFVGLCTAARIRQFGVDLGATLDALILGVALALVAWQSGFRGALDGTTAPRLDVIAVSVLPALVIIAFTLLLRRAFGSNRAHGASRLILAASVFALLTHLVSGLAVLDGEIPVRHIPFQLAFVVLLAAAALHPDMRKVTEPDDVTDGRFGPVRIALLSLALVDAPAVLLLEDGEITAASAPVVAAACAISFFVIIRLISLASEMQRVRQRERVRDQRFESLVRNSSDLIAVLDAEYRVTYLSPAAKEVMGYSPATLLGSSALLGFHRADVDHAKEALDGLTADATSELNLIRLMHASGTWRWIEARAVNLIDDPIVNGIVVNCRDVTQRVMAQAVIDDSIARQGAVAHLGRIALAAPNAWALTKRASLLIRSTLEATSCEILLFDDDAVTDAVVATVTGAVVPDADSHPDREVLDACLDSENPIQFTDPDPNGPLHSSGSLEFTSLEMMLNRPETIVPENVPRTAPQVLAVHVADRERVMGVVLVRSGTPRCFRDDEAGFLATMAGTLGLALSRRMTEASARHQALHDGLTGLPNRALFVDRLANALARIRRSDHRIAVLFLDIDHFKVVNDSLGHSVGDRILVEVADRLSTLLRPGDTVARFGGDEFTVLLDPLGPYDRAEVIAERIRTAVSRATQVGNAELLPTVSIGVAVASSQNADAEAMLRDADAAMYQAKEQGRDSVALFDDTMRDRVIHRLQTEIDLPRAIAEGELFMRYQPIVSLADDTVVGLEALVRWQHPELGEIPPDQFIPVAELSGLIGDLDLWVMRNVMTQCAEAYRSSGLGGPWYALNVSARTVAGHGLADRVAEALAQTGAPPELICLEVTESALMNDMEHSIAVLESLRELGVGISVDDFGTGYSSLAYLRRLPATALKIDGSFIATIERDSRDRAIVESVVNLASMLNMTAVAEGVETRRQVEILAEMNCPMAQGFYLGRPADIPASEVPRAMASEPGRQTPTLVPTTKGV